MRVLILGCGYVGIEVARRLAILGHGVFGLQRSATGSEKLRAAGIEPLAGDITKPADLELLPRDFDWVVNCASSGGGDAADYRALYLEGTKNLVRWLGACPPKKYVYTSSTGVYAQDGGETVTEESPAEPEAEISRILRETELVLMESVRAQEFPALILRVAGIYGPGRGYFFRQFVKGEARIEGDGSRIINMIHRDDVAGCVVAALERGEHGEIYNAVDDEPVTQLEFFKWLSRTLGKPMPPTNTPDPKMPRRRPGTSKRVSNAKLKTELGYQFKFPTFREGYASKM